MWLSFVILGVASFLFVLFIIRSLLFFVKNRNNVPNYSLSEAREQYKKKRDNGILRLAGCIIGNIAAWFLLGSLVPFYQFVLALDFIDVVVLITLVYDFQKMILVQQRLHQLLSS